jgi:hypothetical protein
MAIHEETHKSTKKGKKTSVVSSKRGQKANSVKSLSSILHNKKGIDNHSVADTANTDNAGEFTLCCLLLLLFYILLLLDLLLLLSMLMMTRLTQTLLRVLPIHVIAAMSPFLLHLLHLIVISSSQVMLRG